MALLCVQTKNRSLGENDWINFTIILFFEWHQPNINILFNRYTSSYLLVISKYSVLIHTLLVFLLRYLVIIPLAGNAISKQGACHKILESHNHTRIPSNLIAKAGYSTRITSVENY